MTTFSSDLTEALARYYRNRDLQRHGGPEWNKAADLSHVFAVAKAEGWTVEAVAGKFWFTKPSLLGTRQYTVTESNYRTGGKRNVRETGYLRELGKALSRAFKGKE